MTSPLAYEKVWTDRQLYEEAERKYYENVSKPADIPSVDPGAIKFLEKKFVEFQKIVSGIQEQLNKFDSRLSSLEKHVTLRARTSSLNLEEVPKRVEEDDDDEDVDLFESDSEEESEAAAALRKERLAAYDAKASKKPTLIAKSSVILDIKPWDDTTDMKVAEKSVREIQMDGLLWGASKLVPIAFGIHKLQINCVIEDEKVSVDLLQEQIEQIEDYVQSVDIAAFNKI